MRTNTLPLSRKIKSIAVIGPYADNLSVLVGKLQWNSVKSGYPIAGNKKQGRKKD